VIQCSGFAQWIDTGAAGHGRPLRWARTQSVTCRPLSAATSAVSAPCRTLPAANTPGRGVLAGPDAGAQGAVVEFEAAENGDLVVGNPVGSEDHQVALEPALLARVEVGQGHGLDPPATVDLGHGGARE
jgi:hypothetical protein